MKKNIFLVVGLFAALAFIVFVYLNSDRESIFNLIFNNVVTMNNALLILFSALIGGIIANMFWAYYFERVKEQQYKHIRTAEKASIKAEESTDKVKVLEAKIQTLEEALKKALKDQKK